MPPLLVVDDDEMAREAVALSLGRLNLRNPLVFARDGDEAIGLLQEIAVPALIVLDLEMPGRSGLETLGWVRSEPRLAAVPVLMLTGVAEMAEVDEAYKLGITSYLVKPVGFNVLGDTLRDVGLPWAIVHDDWRPS